MNQKNTRGGNSASFGQHRTEQTRTGAQPLTKNEIDDQLAYIDGVNGSAGHHLDDAYLRDVVRQQIAGEITGEEARELGRKYLESGGRP